VREVEGVGDGDVGGGEVGAGDVGRLCELGGDEAQAAAEDIDGFRAVQLSRSASGAMFLVMTCMYVGMARPASPRCRNCW